MGRSAPDGFLWPNKGWTEAHASLPALHFNQAGVCQNEAALAPAAGAKRFFRTSLAMLSSHPG